jgi:hypothetical protein
MTTRDYSIGPSVPTAASLRKKHRHLAARIAKDRREAARLLAAMREKATTLRMHYRSGRPIWWASSGEFVTAETAAIVIADPNVIPSDAGLPLLIDVPAQSWRYLPALSDAEAS